MICFVDYRTTKFEMLSLARLNLEIITVPKSNLLYSSIDGHPDIQINIINSVEKKVIVHRDIDENFKYLLLDNEFEIILSEKSLTTKYPNDIFLNAFTTNEYFVHNLKYSDNKLLELHSDKKLIHVNQGYTKCSILPVRDKAIITNDISIHDSLVNEGFDVLLLPYGDILLPNLNYGFIGGVGGKITDDTLAFFGTLDKYLFGAEIKKFLYRYDVTPLYLANSKLVDRGSIYTV